MIICIHTGLSLGTKYELTVMARNDLGASDYASTPVIADTSSKYSQQHGYIQIPHTSKHLGQVVKILQFFLCLCVMKLLGINKHYEK